MTNNSDKYQDLLNVEGADKFISNTERWLTMPAGRHILHVDKFMEMDDDALLRHYFIYADFWKKERGWEHKRYSKMFKGRDVVEVGSGFGFDGIMYSQKANSHTYCDINPRQLDFLKRITNVIDKKVRPIKNVKFEWLEDPLSQSFDRKFTALYSHGVLHHVPLAFAKKEFANFNKYLEVGSPVVFLMYPKTRWVDCGMPPFETFGNFTDSGCPWAEYYDEEKTMELVGPGFELNEVIHWGANDREFVNFELTKMG